MLSPLATILMLLFLLYAATGCSGPIKVPPDQGRFARPVTERVVADFDDLDAVVAGILPKFHMIVVDKRVVAPDRIDFQLRMLDDAPGFITIQKQTDSQVEIGVSLGRFPRRRLERDLADALTRRFEQLRGEVAVPIDLPEQPLDLTGE